MIATKRVLTYRIFRIPWGIKTLNQHTCGHWYDPEDYERGYWCGHCGKNLVTGQTAAEAESVLLSGRISRVPRQENAMTAQHEEDK